MKIGTTLLLLCLGFLSGCSNQDNTQDNGNPPAPALSEAKELPLPPIPDPMDADAIMKIWAMDHDETDFMGEISDFYERPGNWKGKRRMGPDPNNLVQSREYSFSAKFVNRRFMTWEFLGEGIPPSYSVMTYFPETDSYYQWVTQESGEFAEYKGKKIEGRGMVWESVVWPIGEGNALSFAMSPGPDGLLMKETVEVMKDGERLAYGEGEAHWMSGPGMELLSAKEIQELVAEPHNPNWEVPEIAELILKSGEWKRVEKIRVRKAEEPQGPLEAAKSLLEGAKQLLEIGEAEDQSQEEMERSLQQVVKYVRGKFVVYIVRNSEGIQLFEGVVYYDSRANLLRDDSIDSNGDILARSVAVPNLGKRELRSKSLPHEDHDRLHAITATVSPDRKEWHYRGKGRENGKLIAVLEGKMEWIGELPKEE